jgi:hypothetical protein
MKIKIFLICFMLAIFINCSDSGGSKGISQSVISEPVIETPIIETPINEPVIETPVVSETPEIIIEDDIIPEIETPIEEEIKMGTLLYYDGSLKNYDGTTITKLFDCGNLVKAGDFYFIDYEVKTLDGENIYDIPEKAVKACVYENVLFYYTENNNLYYINADGISLLVANNPYANHSVILTDSGIRFELAFFDNEAGIYEGQFVGYDQILKIDKINDGYIKSYFNGSEFVEVGKGNYSQFVRWHSLEIDGKAYYTSGAVFDKANLKLTEPGFNVLTKEFKGGSCFNKYIQPTGEKPHFIGIGIADGKGYFINAKDGKIYIFNPVLDTLTEWIKIVEGTNDEDRINSFNLFDKTNAYIYDRFIIYFDGVKIQKINIDTGVKTEIAEATYFKGFNY